MIVTQIDTLLIGGPKPFRADGTMSAMAREPVGRPVRLDKLGFEGDQVADPSVHGGPDKAVHFIRLNITPDGPQISLPKIWCIHCWSEPERLGRISAPAG